MKLDVHQCRNISKTLKSVYYRNRNQHHHSTWWACFCTLNRCLIKLTDHLERDDQIKVTCRSNLLKNVILPKCYRSLSQLIADNQFAVLGVSLLAELAKLDSLFDPITPYVSSNIGRNDALHLTTRLRESEDTGNPVQRNLPTFAVTEHVVEQRTLSEVSGGVTFSTSSTTKIRQTQSKANSTSTIDQIFQHRQ